MTNEQMIEKIAAWIRMNGKLINQAKTEYGADVWSFNKVVTKVMDGGASISLHSPYQDLTIYMTDGKIVSVTGDLEDLKSLYLSFF
jgi:hypothetical protein